MKHDSRPSNGRFDRFDPLNGMRISARDRDTARSAMQNADWITDLLVRTVDEVQALAAAISRLCARGVLQARQMFAKPAPR
jgi:hypothetical protein